jgi:hypothetical protein
MEKARLFHVQLLWNARTWENHALVWGDLDKANALAEGVWANFAACNTCGGGVRAQAHFHGGRVHVRGARQRVETV